jgi:galactokinase
LGEENHALLIDCRSLDYELIPMPQEAALVIGNTKASRSLASSAYNERRSECEQGVALLQQVLPDIRALRDVSSAQLEEHKALLPPVVYRRCRHVITENERVLQTVAALRAGDLVTAMRSTPGCYGARLTGAGFGGCTVALVQPGTEQAIADNIYEQYPKATNIWPEVYTTTASNGASVESLDGFAA